MKHNPSKSQIGKTILGVLLVFSIILYGRLESHSANFTPVLAAALLAGYLFRRTWIALGIVLIAMIVSDAFFQFDSIEMRLSVYGSLSLVVLLGQILPQRSGGLEGKKDAGHALAVAGSAIGGAILFFLITNAAVWAWSGMYTVNLDGLMLSYSNGIPFFRNTLQSAVAFSAVFFVALRAAQWAQAGLIIAHTKAAHQL